MNLYVLDTGKRIYARITQTKGIKMLENTHLPMAEDFKKIAKAVNYPALKDGAS